MAVCTGTGKSGQKVQAGFAPESDKRSWLSAEHVSPPPHGLSSSVSGQISEKRRLKPQSTWAPDLMRLHPPPCSAGLTRPVQVQGEANRLRLLPGVAAKYVGSSTPRKKIWKIVPTI